MTINELFNIKVNKILQAFAFSLFWIYGTYAQDPVQVISLSDKYNTFRDYSPINFEPIADYTKGKRFVAIGESSHGVTDMYFFNSQLARYLMEKGDCRALILEKPFSKILEVNDYIHGAAKDFKKLMNSNGLTPPVRDLIQWMREYNEGAESDQKVSIYGMDINGTNNRDAARYLNNLLVEMEQPVYMDADSLIKQAKGKKDMLMQGYINFVEKGFQNSDMKEILRAKDQEMVTAMIENLKMSLEFHQASPLTMTKKRDQFLFENVKFLEEKLVPKDASIFLWAHNGHIRKRGASFLYKPVGYFLHEKYGSEYMAIAQDFVRGKAYVLGEVTVTEKDNTDKMYVGNFLKEKTGISFLNLNKDLKLENATNIDWQTKFKLHNYTINKGMAKFDNDEFDALILLDEVTSIYDVKDWDSSF